MRLSAALAAAALAASASAAGADATFGIGFTIIFGGDGMKTAVGVKAFSDDEPDKVVGSLGLDYVFRDGGLRPNIGIGYVDEDYFLDLNYGYNFGSGGFEPGFGFGYADVTKPAEPAPPPEPEPELQG